MKLYIVESGEVKTYGATKAIQNEIDKAFLSGGGAVICLLYTSDAADEL